MKKTGSVIPVRKGQSLPMVMILGGVLAIFSAALLSLFQINNKFMVKQNCMMMKQELAGIALEQVLFKLQQDSNWADSDSAIPFYRGYTHEFTNSLGSFAVHITKGNLFLENKNDQYSTRQSPDEYRTIGIKVKTSPTNCIGGFYAVIQNMKFGGPLISKGKINLPCTDAKINDPNFFWGDIYSGNTMSGYCNIPYVPVAKSTTSTHAEWLPKVYSASDIYTAVGYISAGRTGSYKFDYTYDDMSPTAHCHPYSQFATVPELDLQSFKDMATKQGNYYGPAIMQLPLGGSVANPNFINDGLHDNYSLGSVVNDVTQANIMKIMHSLNSPSSVLFIDTTDTLPPRQSPCNSYSGSLGITASALKFYTDSTHQYFTNGMLFVQGPLVLIGDNPSAIGVTAGYTWGYGFASGADCDRVGNVPFNNSYYYPQNTDSLHYVINTSDDTQSYLSNVKHNGLLYCGGELRIGGARVGSTVNSDICIYGSIYLGDQGVLSMETSSDTPKLYVYYNSALNFFSMQSNSLQIISFSDISFLIPTPQPAYPTSF